VLKKLSYIFVFGPSESIKLFLPLKLIPTTQNLSNVDSHELCFVNFWVQDLGKKSIVKKSPAYSKSGSKSPLMPLHHKNIYNRVI
jgi:hypothetical protein